ncbi:MAG: excinuclease ABC subunit UvrC, partial [Ruminococcus sp.]|nr:excinuclease ABC subunit UvrC [Ruminococcus sp.]
DEVHRYSVNYMHTKHNKKTYTSELLKVRGIGEKKAAKLMLAYKTKENLKQASPEELASSAGVNKETALELWKFIQEEF